MRLENKYPFGCCGNSDESAVLKAEIAVYKGSLQSLNEQLAEKDKEIEGLREEINIVKISCNGCVARKAEAELAEVQQENAAFRERLQPVVEEYEKIYHEISDEEIEIAFRGTHFGTDDKRHLLKFGVLESLTGFSSGSTLTQIMKELGLITQKGTVTKKGKLFCMLAFKE